MVDITPILAAVITVLGSIITAFVIPWIKTKLGAEKASVVLSVADAVVLAVEQIYKGMGGEVKKAEAVARVKDWLKQYKIVVDELTLEAAIEAAVKRMNIEIKGE